MSEDKGRPVPPHRSGSPGLPKGIDTLLDNPQVAVVETKNKKLDVVISNDAFIKARPWVCCQRPLIITEVKDESDGKVKPLIVLCDKKVGHTGLHRGRGENRTWIWRGRSENTIKADRIAEQKRAERASKRGQADVDVAESAGVAGRPE